MFDRQLNRRRLAGAGLALLLAGIVAVSGVTIAVAQSFDDQLTELQTELGESFEILPLSDGWLLRPLDEALGLQTLELNGQSGLS